MINWKTETINTKRNMISNEHLSETVYIHKIDPSFAKRPLTTFFIEALSKCTSLTIGEAFTIVNFTLLFFCGIALFYLAKLALGDVKNSNYSVLFFYLSFTILFSFFPTNYSYDEPLQYLLLFGSLFALIKKKWGLFILYFSFSLVARESSIILLPAIALYFMTKEFKLITRILVVILPVCFYIVFLYVFMKISGLGDRTSSDFSGRLSHFLINFQDQKYGIESLFSLVLAIGVHLYFLMSYLSKNTLSSLDKKLIKAFILSTIINTVIVLISTLARETRLFALPLIFLWPIFGKILYQELRILAKPKNYLQLVNNILPIGTLLVLWSICFLVYRFIYIQTNGVTQNFLDEYLLVLSALISLHFVIKTRLKYKGIKE